MGSYIVINKKDGKSEHIYFNNNLNVLDVASKIKYAMDNNLEVEIESNLHAKPVKIIGSEIKDIKVKG